MPPKKGKGKAAGKRPAPKGPAPAPQAPVAGANDPAVEEANDPVAAALLARIVALEEQRAKKRQGAPALPPSKKSKEPDISPFLKQLMACVVLLEEGRDSGSAAQDGDRVSGPVSEGSQQLEVYEGPEVAADQAGAVGWQERKRVIICGHSMIFWAAHQAKRTAFGSQLGLSESAVVEWW